MTTHLITMGFTFPSLDLIHLPKVIRDWIADFLKLIMIDLTSFMSSPECEWKANPLEKYIIKMTLPVIFVITFTLWNLFHKARYAFCSYCWPAEQEYYCQESRNKHNRIISVAFYLGTV